MGAFGNMLTRLGVLNALCAVCAVTLLLAGTGLAQEQQDASPSELENTDPCTPEDDCRIPYEYLSSEQTDPYLVSGQPPTIWADVRAAKRWPNVRSCLERGERNAEKPNLVKIDWNRMRRAEDIEVCMFRIFSSIRTETGLVHWFESQDITWSWFNVRDFKTLLPGGRNRVILRRVEASTRPSDSNRFLVKDSIMPKLFLRWIVRSEKFFVTWSEDGRVFDTEYGQSNLF